MRRIRMSRGDALAQQRRAKQRPKPLALERASLRDIRSPLRCHEVVNMNRLSVDDSAAATGPTVVPVEHPIRHAGNVRRNDATSRDADHPRRGRSAHRRPRTAAARSPR